MIRPFKDMSSIFVIVIFGIYIKTMFQSKMESLNNKLYIEKGSFNPNDSMFWGLGLFWVSTKQSVPWHKFHVCKVASSTLSRTLSNQRWKVYSFNMYL